MSDSVEIKKAKSFEDIMRMKFKMLDFQHEWKELIGTPECSGSWIIWGDSANGKTRFCLGLAKYLCQFEKVYYNTIEEGMRASFKQALIENNIQQVKRQFKFESENLAQMRKRLSKKRSPKVVFVDSIQYLQINKKQFSELISDFPKHLFIFTSHAKGDLPKGEIADSVRYHSDVKIQVKGYKAFAKSRYGGGKPYVIWEEGAAKYWNDIE